LDTAGNRWVWHAQQRDVFDKTAAFDNRLFVGCERRQRGKDLVAAATSFPSVSSIKRLNASPTANLEVHFLVTFNDNVTAWIRPTLP